MPKDRKNTISDGELSEMFLRIGRAKEKAAKGIIAEQKKEEEEKRKQLKDKFKLFGGVTTKVKDDVDIDEQVRQLEQEIEWVRSGKIHKYNENKIHTEDDSECHGYLKDDVAMGETSAFRNIDTSQKKDPFDILDVPNMTEETQEKASVTINAEEPEVTQPEISQLEETVDEIELDGVAIEPELVRAYFTASYDTVSEIGKYACDIYQGETIVESITDTVNTDILEKTIFIGATKMVSAIEKTECTSAILVMPKDIEELLRKNAIYGLTGDFGNTAVKYIRDIKELSMKCYLRVSSETFSKEFTTVSCRV